MLIDMLSFLSTNPDGAGFNEIARYLAGKGFTPLYSGRHVGESDRKFLLHPKTLRSLLKNALEEELIAAEHPLGQSPKGKRNRYLLTKKGNKRLIKSEEIRFIEDSDPQEVKVPLKAVEKAFFAAEGQLDAAALNFSKPLGPGDQLTSPEDMFFAERNTKVLARRLLSTCKIKLFVPKGSSTRPLIKEQIEQLSFLLAAYSDGQSAFRIVLSHDPLRADPTTNPTLLSDLSDLELYYFFRWLHDFKRVKVDAKDFRSLLPYIFGNRKPNSKLMDVVDRYKELWAEFDVKRERVDNVMREIRKYGIEFEEWRAKLTGNYRAMKKIDLIHGPRKL